MGTPPSDDKARFDLHTHHVRCGHAAGDLHEYAEAACRAGLGVLGLSPHSPFFSEDTEHFKPWVAMAKGEFARYIDEAMAIRHEYAGRLEILLGVESDFVPATADHYARVLSVFPLDYIIGSVHILGEYDIFNPQRWGDLSEANLLRQKEEYCSLVARSARCGHFDILGHIDGLKGNCPAVDLIDTPAIEMMLASIAAADAVIEVNTSGGTKECGGWYPAPEILERARSLGVKVTFGSDAHSPDRVAEDLDAVRDHLRSIGYHEWYFFRDRRPVAVML